MGLATELQLLPREVQVSAANLFGWHICGTLLNTTGPCPKELTNENTIQGIQKEGEQGIDMCLFPVRREQGLDIMRWGTARPKAARKDGFGGRKHEVS